MSKVGETSFSLKVTATNVFLNGKKVAQSLVKNSTFNDATKLIHNLAELNRNRVLRRKMLRLTRKKCFKRLLAGEFGNKLSDLLKDKYLTPEQFAAFIDEMTRHLELLRADEKFTNKLYALKPNRPATVKTVTGHTLQVTMHPETITDHWLIVKPTPNLSLTFDFHNTSRIRQLLFSDRGIIAYPDELLDVKLRGKSLNEEDAYNVLNRYEAQKLGREFTITKGDFKRTLLKNRLKNFASPRTIKRKSASGTWFTIISDWRKATIKTSVGIALEILFNGISSDIDYKYSMLASVLTEPTESWQIRTMLECCEAEVTVEGMKMRRGQVSEMLVECLCTNVKPSINALLKENDT
jgi:hypothetical protein